MNKAKVFFPNLDGIRFVCFFAVFLSHSLATNYAPILNHPVYITFRRMVQNGGLGVNFFFVLSGFLITYLLITERETTGKINIPHFYFRRVLRIWPLYFFCIFFGFVLFPLIKKLIFVVPSVEPANFWMYITFLANFDCIRADPDSTVLGSMWSVAVEEQFYFFWPLLIGLLRPKWYKFLFFTVIIISLAARWRHISEYFWLQRHTLAVMSDLSIGAISAYMAYYHTDKVRRICNVHPLIIGLIYILTLVCFYFKLEIAHSEGVPGLLERILFGLLFAFIILEQCYSDRSFFKFSRLKFLDFWGKYTYGLYCLHYICILTVDITSARILHITNIYAFMAFGLIVPFFLSLLFSYISYRYYESPFLRIKHRFSAVITKQ